MKVIKGLPDIDLHTGQPVALDVETFGQEKGKLHRPTGSFACLSIAVQGSEKVWQIYDQQDVKKVMAWAGRKASLTFHHAPYDLRQLRRYARVDPRPMWDTRLVDRNLWAGYYQGFTLGDLTRRNFGVRLEKEVRAEFGTVTEMTPRMIQYAALDAAWTLRIRERQVEQIEERGGLDSYWKIDGPMVWVVIDMPGVRIDVGRWAKLVERFQRKSAKLEAELGINVMSPAQVKKFLAEHDVEVGDTQHETLELAAEEDPIVNKVIQARRYRKAISTYGMSWLANNVEADGYVYPDADANGTETSRMTFANPNLQQIPIRYEEFAEYRQCFIASPGNKMLVADISQQEPRIACYLSQDEALLAAFKSKEDVYLYIARMVYGKVTAEYRRRAKDVLLGAIYGLTSYGLARRAKIGEDEASRILATFFNRFIGLNAWIGMVRNQGLMRGYVTTVGGHRIHLNPYGGKADNNAVNGPVQGSAAAQTKLWSIGIWRRCREAGLPFALPLIIHDETTQDVPSVVDYRRITKAAFDETAKTLFPGIPFKMGMVAGATWGVKT